VRFDESMVARVEMLVVCRTALPDGEPFRHPRQQLFRPSRSAGLARSGPAWTPEGSSFKCQQDGEDFGVLVSQDRSSMHARLKLVSQEKYEFVGRTVIACV
jgi:hypothetical protein